jgi:hypothetical protein
MAAAFISVAFGALLACQSDAAGQTPVERVTV